MLHYYKWKRWITVWSPEPRQNPFTDQVLDWHSPFVLSSVECTGASLTEKLHSAVSTALSLSLGSPRSTACAYIGMPLLINIYRNKPSVWSFNDTHLGQIWTRCFSVWNDPENGCSECSHKVLCCRQLFLVWITNRVYALGHHMLTCSQYDWPSTALTPSAYYHLQLVLAYGLISTLVCSPRFYLFIY